MMDVERPLTPVPPELPPDLPSAPPPVPNWKTYPGSKPPVVRLDEYDDIQYFDDEESLEHDDDDVLERPSQTKLDLVEPAAPERPVPKINSCAGSKLEENICKGIENDKCDRIKTEQIAKRAQFLGLRLEDSEEYKKVMEGEYFTFFMLISYYVM